MADKLSYRKLKDSLDKLSDQELNQDVRIADIQDGTEYYAELFSVPVNDNDDGKMAICFDSCSQHNRFI